MDCAKSNNLSSEKLSCCHSPSCSLRLPQIFTMKCYDRIRYMSLHPSYFSYTKREIQGISYPEAKLCENNSISPKASAKASGIWLNTQKFHWCICCTKFPQKVASYYALVGGWVVFHQPLWKYANRQNGNLPQFSGCKFPKNISWVATTQIPNKSPKQPGYLP